jgi:hypothetical protein
MTSFENSQIFEDLRNKILGDIVIPNYEQDIICMLKYRSVWSRVAVFLNASATISTALSTIFIFLASNNNNFQTVAGLFGILALVCTQLHNYSNNQGHIKTIELNKLLENLKIDFKFPDFTQDQKINYMALRSDEISSEKLKINSVDQSTQKSYQKDEIADV